MRTITWIEMTEQSKIDDAPDLGLMEVTEGAVAFVGTQEIGAIFTFGDDHWYGSFFGERIGSCADREMAKRNIERRWKLTEEGKSGGFM